jgi:hypothetical protein
MAYFGGDLIEGIDGVIRNSDGIWVFFHICEERSVKDAKKDSTHTSLFI